MSRRVGEHVERLVLLVGAVEQDRVAPSAERSVTVSSRARQALDTEKSRCICIGTSCSGQVVGSQPVDLLEGELPPAVGGRTSTSQSAVVDPVDRWLVARAVRASPSSSR